ncbi:MAG: MFS transporter [Pseudomonadota bacterium]
MTPAQVRGLAAAIAAITIFAFGFSLLLPLMAVLLEGMGATGWEIGVVNASAAVAMVCGGFILPSIARSTGVPALLLTNIGVMALLLCTFLLVPNIWAWAALRFLMGFVAVSIFYASEIWIITLAPDARRGLFIGIYGFFLSIGFLVGPVLLQLVGTEGWPPFLWGAALTLLAAIPVIWAWNDGPDISEGEEDQQKSSFFDVFKFFRTDPAIMGAVALFGCIEFGAMGLIPVWSLKAGMTETMALTLVALLAGGNVAMMLPMGWLGDKFDRRSLLKVSAALCVVLAILIPSVAETLWPLWLLTAFFGGVVVGLYTFSLNEMGNRYKGADFARANGAFMTAYGLGALVAPPVLGAAMDAMPPHGMFNVLVLAAGGYLALLLLRRRR